MVAATWKGTRQSIIVNCFMTAGFGTQGPETAKAAPHCMSAVQQHEDAWEYHCSVDEVPTEISFSEYMSADANVVTTEVLDDKDIVRLIVSMEGVAAEDADTEEGEVPVPTPSQVMDALDLLRQFTGVQEGTKDALDALQT
ncbi:hypothetical protein HPB50_002711 [Hyalomma asiaticum]|uniref:Uncharacterized protein n=1 Tax=Hyalomma asiaticum TaxID=266040 RepID=A0ACB7TB98_HYAAI|nr:hypothetical protein HPB50_002711 [Hyalomma asiaticum]